MNPGAGVARLSRGFPVSLPTTLSDLVEKLCVEQFCDTYAEREAVDPSLKQRLKTLVLSKASLLSIVDQLRQIKNEGIEQAAVHNALEDLRKDSQTESQEDRILEVLDFVTGYCSPANRVWGREPPEQIE